MDNYQRYRKKQNQLVSDYFTNKPCAVQEKYPYILKSRDDWAKNIILPEVYTYIRNESKKNEEAKKPFPVHKYIHHGLSSQALLFNLVGYFVWKKDFEVFRNIFIDDAEYITGDTIIEFEHSDRGVFNENRQQPTSFDLALINEEGRSIFVEAKYVETNFGGCSVIDNGNCEGMNPIQNNELCYLHKLERNYWKLMRKYGADEAYKNDSICPLAIYYQFYREILFAKEKNGIYYLLYDERNPAFVRGNNRGLFNVLHSRLPDGLKEITKKISIQQVVSRLKYLDAGWLNELIEKHGLQ